MARTRKQVQTAAQHPTPTPTTGQATPEERTRPQLHPRDWQYARAVPIQNRLQTEAQRAAVVDELRAICEGDLSSVWIDIVKDWFLFCAGVEVNPISHLETFVEILALRVGGDEDAALRLLEHEQAVVLAELRAEGKHVPIVSGLPDGDGESDEESDMPSGEDVRQDVAENLSTSAKNSFIHMAMSSRVSHIFAGVLQSHAEWWCDLCGSWASRFKKFLFSNKEYVADDHLAAIDALRGIRAVPDTVGKTANWRKAVKFGSLARVFELVCSPAAHLLVQPHSLTSFRLNAWTVSLSERWHAWTDYGDLDAIELPAAVPDGTKTDPVIAQDFVKALCDYPNIIPSACDPLSVLFLTTEDAFMRAWNTWLKRSLLKCGATDALTWHPRTLYRLLMGMSEKNFTKVCWEDFPAELQTILTESWEFCNMRLDQAAYAHHPAGASEPLAGATGEIAEEGSSSKRVWVSRRSREEMDDLEGVAVTWADEEDRLPPKGIHGARASTTYMTPEELGLREIKPDLQIIARCKRHIVKIMDNDTKSCVGGIRYNLLHPETLQGIKDSHEKASANPSVQRGMLLRAWQYGKMVPFGFRVPQGGRAGDGYTTYGTTRVENIDDMKMIFSVACDTECIVQALRASDPPSFHKLRDVTRDAQMHRIGTTGPTAFYCVNYLSCQHLDTETACSMSCQLGLDTEYSDEYDFAYTEYGVVFRTVENCGWWFDASKVHGSVMPRLSTVNKGAKRRMSTGIHITIRKKDMEKSAYLSSVLDLHDARCAIWKRRM
ncbi:hypothetical protein EIP91_009169 [Steccherinum ochraceum]|uniref:Uncharacterized protein n=1 Tax=Steccherinum ochraceum TaxID=92696 RepID=A0A4R0RA35_9APHY|nr:hypothetical protein EIP91_009169 [Steccherinum ochraceum]